MNNFKKIGLTALAGSLVATSVAYAGALEVTGAAEMKVSNHSYQSVGKNVGMANNIYFKGSGETDGGLNVALSFELDDGSDSGNGSAVWDNHSVSVGNDTIGTIAVHGHGGSNAAAALDTTAAGDLWDSTLGISSAVADKDTPQASTSGNDIVVYTLPTMVDGLAAAVSYTNEGETHEASTAFGITYTGVEGLSVSYGQGESSGTINVDADQTIMKASYAIGSFTLAASNNDLDHTTIGSDQEVKSYSVAYTVSEELSVSYGVEDISRQGAADVKDIEVSGYKASYTSGGMTVAAQQVKADNVDYTNGANNDNDMWKLSLSFAF
jgi:outer membrane protein OmpU